MLKKVLVVVLMFLVLSGNVFSVNKKIFSKNKPKVEVYYRIYVKDKTIKQQGQKKEKLKRVVVGEVNPKDIEEVIFYFYLFNPPQSCQFFLEVDFKNLIYKDPFLFEKLIDIMFYFDDRDLYNDEAQTVRWCFQTSGMVRNQYGLKFDFLKKRIPKTITMIWKLKRKDFIKLLKYNKKSNVIKSQKIYDKKGNVKEEILSFEKECIIEAVAYNNERAIGRFFLPLQEIFIEDQEKEKTLKTE